MPSLYKEYEKKVQVRLNTVKSSRLSISLILSAFFKLKNELTNAKRELRQAWSLLQMDDLKCRKRVLRRLGYCNEQDVIDTKGRVACEIDT